MRTEIKQKVRTLWDKFWSGGMSNPLAAIEQITYLLFIKQLDTNDTRNISNSRFTGIPYTSIFEGDFKLPEIDTPIPKENMRWSQFTRMPAEEMYRTVQTQVFPFIKQLGGENQYFTRHMQNAALLLPSPRLLVEAIMSIEDIYSELEKEDRFSDAQGDFYEYLLSELNQAGKNGQFRTPPHIIELIVELVRPQLGQKIADPACGTAGFLLGAYNYILTEFTSEEERHTDDNGFTHGSIADRLVDESMRKTINEETFFGFDIDPTMIRIGLMNLMMHGITKPQIDYKDTLSKNYNEDNEYDIVLTNPPFTGNIDKGDLNETFSIKTTKSELLFLERIYKMLRIGGTAGVIIPQGVLFGSSTAHKGIRKILVESCDLKAVISMPGGVFKPYAGVATAILIFTKGGETENVWFYDMESDGYSLDDKRTKLKLPDGEPDYGDIHKIRTAFKTKDTDTDRSRKHFIVSKDEIIENEYDLSINKYREEIYEEIKYKDPKVYLRALGYWENKIQKGIEDLKDIFS